ncbi:type II and III secretion system protein family protein [Celerinatantimonas sp. MCCC 1A17872]|uniref:type II and III secretion system protein family protein n=1 Tax=Celerinatantimonas sp. MCCC 1A17872 TaxID=3177514 RepID=UPI0038C0CD4C
MMKVLRLGLLLVGVCLSQSGFAAILSLSTGGAKTIHTDELADTVFISNPSIADYRVLDGHRVILFGKAVGTTSLIIYDKAGQTLLNRQIIVNQSMAKIEQQIAIHYPDLAINVANIGTQVVVSGEVPDIGTKEAIVELIGVLLNKSASKSQSVSLKSAGSVSSSGGSSSSESDYSLDYLQKTTYSGIVDNLKVGGIKQVNVKLSVAEVSTAYIKQLGAKWGSMVDDSFQGNGQFFNYLQSFNASNIASFISALDNDTVGQILAQPNLSVISGETASFLVGGELPIVTNYDNSYQVTYKEYGVKLSIGAKVLNDKKIRLTLSPEVSAQDSTYTSELADVPAFKTRKATTTVELGDGQSFVLGGLLSKDEQETLQKVPFIGDIPILGAMFRYTETTRRNTELVIVATVNLVKPIAAEDVRLPAMQTTSTLSRWFGVDLSASSPATRAVYASGGFKQ